MLIQPNPFVVLSGDDKVALNVLDGSVSVLDGAVQARLKVLRQRPTEFEPDDMRLLELEVARLTTHAEVQKRTVRSAVEEFLAARGALCVMPTEKCNFRCTYCYEDFEKGRMPPEKVAAIEALLEQEVPKFKTYSLAWFGGEPLLQPDIVIRVSKRFRELQARCGSLGSVAITTNGSRLSEDLLHKLAEVGIDLFHISVDGPRTTHNLQRKSQGGEDTYDLILDNIERALEMTESQVLFRINFKQGNRQDAADLAGWFDSEIKPRFSRFGSRFRPHLVSIWNASLTSVDGICLSDAQAFQVWFDLKRSILQSMGTYPLRELAASAAEIGSLACYAGKPNHYVIGSDGSVYKCTVAFKLPENRIGFLSDKGELVLDPQREAVWTSANSLTDPTCSACAFSASCMGLHCPLTRLQTGAPPCPTEKRFVDAFLSADVELISPATKLSHD